MAELQLTVAGQKNGACFIQTAHADWCRHVHQNTLVTMVPQWKYSTLHIGWYDNLSSSEKL